MKRLVFEVDYSNRCFYVIDNNKKIGIYLTHKQNRTYMSYLKPGMLVDIRLMKKRFKHLGVYMYRLDYFNKIIRLNPYYVIFDINILRKEMFQVITNQKHYLFVDFEMTMPEYRDIGFFPEIIQFGYVLTNNRGNIIEQDGFYVDKLNNKPLTNRTIRFLNITQQDYDLGKVPYNQFYDVFSRLIKKYNPKIITWGKNDQQVLSHSYQVHNKEVITDSTMFMDLLKLYKDYFRLKNDVGLFRTYEMYYNVDAVQNHDAMDDAIVTYKVFEAFIKSIKNS